VNEEGVDAGGLFKEFIIDLVSEAFAPKLGLFLANDEGYLYPNPQSFSRKYLCGFLLFCFFCLPMRLQAGLALC
jgi:hypothetical protein